MDILSNSKDFFENMSSEEFTNLLDEFGFDYEIANRKMSNIDRPFISMLNELPINKKDIIDNKILPLIKIIESDINFELMNLSEYNRKWYRESYQNILKDYMNINKIIKTKRDISFSELCEFYNSFLFEYKYFRDILCGNSKNDDCEYLNRRVGWYKLKLDFIKEIFEIEYKGELR
ncbi:hypothetical protein JJB71_13485 [Clostridium perfringens]|uniref:hypothetical protein n=1 Tax=Clostridium perfringens TaxID=1502 RepID=UPI001ABAEEA6|nr:hypothetical protein [Clostridium perfringens]MBO3398551.1 hypothetical protein [Clostridium perfringens]